MAGESIADHGIIGDGRSVALVSRTGAIRWLCWPRFDSPSVFGELLDPEGGVFSIRPAGEGWEPEQTYIPLTNVLQTQWRRGSAALRVIDFMPALDEEKKGETLRPENALVRLVECTGGQVEVEVNYRPRPDYGRRPAVLRPRGKLGVCVSAGRAHLTLSCDRSLDLHEGRARFTLRSGDRASFVLSYDSEAPAVIPPPQLARDTFFATVSWWRRWARRARYQGPYRDEVIRSALTVKLLNFAPSGAIIAAPTTSLPERLGGDLNWDYRFCWTRDASMTVRALHSLGYEEEVDAFVSWMLHATALTRPEMGVLYDVWGRLPAKEEVLDHWSGYKGSRPVRLRNGASEQLQLDSYGEVIDAIIQYVRAGGTLDGETGRMLSDFGAFVCRHWEHPDSGIWEPRGEPRHYTHSKVLSWVALDRLIELHDRFGLRRMPIDRFRMNRDLLCASIREHGWNEQLQSYTQTYGGATADASLLLLSWYGFEDARAHRMRSTAQAIVERLSPGPGLLYRYEQSRVDGEGAFLICSFWLAELLARGAGSLPSARALFDVAVRYASPLGLMSEEVEPQSGEALGNYPQAFSHIGLVGAALAFEERATEERERGRTAGWPAEAPR